MRGNRSRLGVVPSRLDLASVSAGSAQPGNDPRQWVSIGIVGGDDAEAVVQFRTDLGQVLVKVTLEPSKTPVYCRVGSQVAGAGEAEYHPFLQGDEVVVVIPEGYEDAGCVIIARLNNNDNAFPMDSVAGQDPTTNTFGFSRRRTPFVHEYAGPVILRSALSSALITIDATGHITLKDSEGAAIQLSADVIGIQGPSDPSTPPEFLLQLDLTHRHFVLQVGDAVMTLSASDGSPEVNTITVPGAMTIGTIGNPPIEHVATTESVANVLEKLFAELAATIAAGGSVTPLTGVTLAGLITAWLAAPTFPGVWATAAAAPLGAISTTLPTIIAGLFAASPPKPTGIPYQTFPGIGAPGLLVG